jgi:hypothetical protein
MRRFVLAVLTFASFQGCVRSTSYYLHPQADLGAIRRVAVLPFETMTAERAPADKVQKVFLLELLATNAFDVIEPGAVVKALKDERVENVGNLAPQDIGKLAKAMGAEGLFFGTVVDYGESRGVSSTAPEITIQLRLVDGTSGATVWSASRTRNGATVSARLFGLGGDSSTEVVRDLIREELSTLLVK